MKKPKLTSLDNKVLALEIQVKEMGRIVERAGEDLPERILDALRRITSRIQALEAISTYEGIYDGLREVRKCMGELACDIQNVQRETDYQLHEIARELGVKIQPQEDLW